MGNPPEDGPCEVTITAPDRDWLQTFVRRLVDGRLAAAAHVDTMQTTYRWVGEVHEAIEARAIVHTTLSRVSDIVSRVSDEHPYEVPCVIAKPVIAGNETYIKWMLSAGN